MASANRSWLSPVLIAAAVLASALVYPRLPSLVDVRFDGMLPFDVASAPEPISREVALFLIPMLALVLWLAFRAVPTATGQRFGRLLFRKAPAVVTSVDQFHRFGATYDTIVLGVMVLLLGFHAALLATMLAQPALGARIIPMVFGGCLVLMGNVMPRTRPNWVAGVRTERTLADPQLWRDTHRVFGAALVVAGLLTIVVGLASPRYGLETAVASLVTACVIGFLASRRGREHVVPAA